MRTGIALGSNVGDRLANLAQALGRLRNASWVKSAVSCSGVYETAPIGDGAGTDSFLNAVVEFEYEGLPFTLLEKLKQMEAAMGRPSKRPRNAPRTIDLDILYVGNLVLANEEIVIPHPRLHMRRFVLQPLADIAPDLLLPGQQLRVSELLAVLKDDEPVVLFSKIWQDISSL